MATEALTGLGATGARGTLTPVISIGLTGVSASARFGFVTSSDAPGESFAITTPTLQITMTGVSGGLGVMAIDHPLPVLAMTGDVPVAARVIITAPRPSLTMAGVTGTTGTMVIAAPTMQIVFGSGESLTITHKLPTLTMSGVLGAIGELILAPPKPALVLTGKIEYLGTMAMTAPLPAVRLDGVVGAAGSLTVAHKLPALEMDGVVGNFGTLNLDLPAPLLRMSGALIAVGSMAITAPHITLVMTGLVANTPVQVSTTRVTYALQTERMALTQYTNFPFNSFAVFGGRVLGASADGIFELTGDTDAGVQIDAAARLGITDLNTTRVKRVEYVYIGHRAMRGARALLLRVTTNETQQRDYGMPPSITSGLHTGRVMLGMGVESRYWQFELRNRGGAAFTLDTLEVRPTPLRRRVGAKDA